VGHRSFRSPKRRRKSPRSFPSFQKMRRTLATGLVMDVVVDLIFYAYESIIDDG
jgi:hypothetical protein